MEGSSTRSGSSKRKSLTPWKVKLASKRNKVQSESDGDDVESDKESVKSDAKKSAENSVESNEESVGNSDDDTIPELPEGTIVVKPQPVREKKPRFHGPEFSKGSKELAIVNCTACSRQINPGISGAAKRHPDLQVLICKKCWSYYRSGEIAQDEDGLDEQCRWCGEGGKLLGCDFCHNAFCKQCILRNFGRAELSSVMGDDETKWKCYVCNKDQLATLLKQCDEIFKQIEKEKLKDKTRQLNSCLSTSSKKSRSLKSSKSSGKSANCSEHVDVEFEKDIFNLISDFEISPPSIDETVVKFFGITNTFQTMLEVMKTDLEFPATYSMSDTPPLEGTALNRFAEEEKRSRCARTLKKGLKSFMKSVKDILESQENSKDFQVNSPLLENGNSTEEEVVEKQSKSSRCRVSENGGGSHDSFLEVEEIDDDCLGDLDTTVDLGTSNKKVKHVKGRSTSKYVPESSDSETYTKERKMLSCSGANYSQKDKDNSALDEKSSDSDEASPSKLKKSSEKDKKVSNKCRKNSDKVPVLSTKEKKSKYTKSVLVKKSDLDSESSDEEITKVEPAVDSDIPSGGHEDVDLDSSHSLSDANKVKLEVDSTTDHAEVKDEMIVVSTNIKEKTKDIESVPTSSDSQENEAAQLELLKELAEEIYREQESGKKKKKKLDKKKNDAEEDNGLEKNDGEKKGGEEVSSDDEDDKKKKGKRNDEGKGTKKKVEEKKDEEEVSSDDSEDNRKKKGKSNEGKKAKQNGERKDGNVSSDESEDDGKEKEKQNDERKKGKKNRERKDEKVSSDDSGNDRKKKGKKDEGKNVKKNDGARKDEVSSDDSGDDRKKKGKKDEGKKVKKNDGARKDEVSSDDSGGDKKEKGKKNEGKKAKKNDGERKDKKEVSGDDSEDDRKKKEKNMSENKSSSDSEEGDQKIKGKENDRKTKENKDQKKDKKEEKKDEKKEELQYGSDDSRDDDSISSSDLIMSSDGEFARRRTKKRKKGSKRSQKEKCEKSFQKQKNKHKPNSDDDSIDDNRKKKKRKESEEKRSKAEISTITKKKDRDEKKSNRAENLDSDEEFEKELELLSRNPLMKKQKKEAQDSDCSNVDSESSKSELKKNTGKNSEVETQGKKTKMKKDTDSSMSSCEDDVVDDVEEEEEEEEMGDKDLKPMEVNNEGEDYENDMAKKALLDELKEDEDTDKEEEDHSSSDSDIGKKKSGSNKKKEDKKKSEKDDEENEDESMPSENEDSDAVPARRKKINSSLLNAKLSESDSDVDDKKQRKVKVEKTRGKKRKKESDESFEGHSSEENGESDSEKSESEDSSDNEEDSSSYSDSSSGKKKSWKTKTKGKKKVQKGKKGRGRKRRRIRAPKDSSDENSKGGSSSSGDDDDNEDEDGVSPSKKGHRKKIRKIKSDKKLTDETKAARKAEEERRKRVAERQKLFNNVKTVDDENSPMKCPITTQLVLEADAETKDPILQVNKKLVRKLKPHQVEAVQFIWDCCCESLKRMKKEEGSGCILAHCMGLGKSLSVIGFVHTLLSNPKLTKMSTCLVVCPLNTVLNWTNEWKIWLSEKDRLDIFELASIKQNHSRADYLKDWHDNGGIMIIGYEMYRNLTQTARIKNKRLKRIFAETLVDPGPDLVVCDEGHILKNDASAVSQAMNKIRTKRRVVLTGTPLQNNLSEYHCMASFVKPNLMGTRKEFCNRFVNPITNGQCSDSTTHDVRLMKRRAHVLHEMLAGCVQRRDYSALTKFLPPKFEYVISVRLHKMQMDMYEKYLELTGQGLSGQVVVRGARLFSDYQSLMKIWTHPWVMRLAEIRAQNRAKYDDTDEEEEEDENDSFIDDSEEEEESSTDANSEDSLLIKSENHDEQTTRRGRKTRAQARNDRKNGKEDDSDELEVVSDWKTKSRGGGEEGECSLEVNDDIQRPVSNEWWAEFVNHDDAHKVELSGKLVLLFEILKMCEEIGDKVLVFSQSLLSLDIIEDFLDTIDKRSQEEAAEKLKTEEMKKKKAEKKKKDEEEEEEGSEKKKEEEDEKKKKEEEDEKKKEAEDSLMQTEFGKSWTKGADYFRMDGSTSAHMRNHWSQVFNDPENFRSRLFLISTKAGSLGINLVAANRVIIFDASWNPSHDIQSIFRVYRFGQAKPCYVYRFLAQGTMEEKIYERQVTKQSLSQRVVDEHQIDRHFTAQDLQELYHFRPERLDDPNKPKRPTPTLPKDHLLAELLMAQKDWIVTYHEHDSLLENKIEQELSEEDKKAAWEEYENDRKGVSRGTPQTGMAMGGYGMMYGGQALSADNVLQIVQAVKAQFPNLPPDMFQAQVQRILQQQIMQQQEMQKRQIEQRQMQEMERLRQIREQIERQQQQISSQGQVGFGGGNMGVSSRFPVPVTPPWMKMASALADYQRIKQNPNQFPGMGNQFSNPNPTPSGSRSLLTGRLPMLQQHLQKTQASSSSSTPPPTNPPVVDLSNS